MNESRTDAREPRRARRTRVCALTVCALLAAAAAQAVEAGEAAPAFRAPALRGNGDVSLDEYRGKVVFLDFWASWCGPCLQSIPQIEEMRRALPADRFQVVAVNVDRDPVKAQRFLRRVEVGYPSASDPFGEVPSQFGVETMPTSFVIDANGVVRYVHHGFRNGDIEQLRGEIDKLVAQLPGGARSVPAAPAARGARR